MPVGFAPRFAIEAGFLILLGVGAGFADLDPAWIIAVLGGGWLLVSLAEWLIWRSAEAQVAAPPSLPPQPDAGPELDPDPGWARSSGSPSGFPLRVDAGSEPPGEIEAYTRVLDEKQSELAAEDEAKSDEARPADERRE